VCDRHCSSIDDANAGWMYSGGDAFFLGGGLRALLEVDERDDEERRDLLQSRAFSVVLQRAGETVYVPYGWYHAVYNLDLTVAVTEGVGERLNLFRSPNNFVNQVMFDDEYDIIVVFHII
jgi:hypothetical protein